MTTLTENLTKTKSDATSEPATVPVLTDRAPRPAWIEIDLRRLKQNYQLINRDKPCDLKFLAVIKDHAYGHGALPVAKVALESGAAFLAVSTLEEAMALRDAGIKARILLLGDRPENELPWCIAHDLTCCVSEPHAVAVIGQLAATAGKHVPVHLKINTGMNRYGVRWNEALPLVEQIRSTRLLTLEGVISHLAQSDEADKTFARLQLSRFNAVLADLPVRGISPGIRHLCNSGGFLDLPEAHFDMVRLGILPLGIFPSAVCRRIPGIAAVMSVKARLAAIQNLQPGDHLGYGMRYTAKEPRRIAVLPIGYGDGFPRVRNLGWVLIHGRRAPVVGGVSMDALMVDITEIPEAKLWDVAVVMGRQGDEEITVHDIAKIKNSASYDVLCSWRGRLPRIYLNDDPAP